jgi:transcriptional regulator with XRE-family HTH domain
MRAHELIRAARESSGLVAGQVARRLDMSAAAYSDVEQHPDEITTNVSLADVKRLCEVLGLDIWTLVVAEFDEQPIRGDNSAGAHRHVLLRTYREARKASISEVAAAIGFDDETILSGETDDHFIETLPLGVIHAWSRYIGLPVEKLIR